MYGQTTRTCKFKCISEKRNNVRGGTIAEVFKLKQYNQQGYLCLNYLYVPLSNSVMGKQNLNVCVLQA